MNMNIALYKELLKYLNHIIKGSKYEGHVYAVGGCVRDSKIAEIEGKEGKIKDIDLVVDLPNGGIEFAKFLDTSKYIKGSLVIYENFGTVMFRLKKYPEIELEAVQTRSECYRDENSRNPETSYGTIEQDAFRRDFTINALYYDISAQKEIDFNGHGLEDLNHHIIDTCGDPDIIFDEDPLRIMRAVRFATRLGYCISERTITGIKKHVNRLKIISQERITDEFNKIITTENPQYGLCKLQDFGIMDIIIPELKDKLSTSSMIKLFDYSYDLDRINLTAENKGKGDAIIDKKIMILSFLSYFVDPLIFTDVMVRMKYSNDDIKSVYFYASHVLELEDINKRKDEIGLRSVEYKCKTKAVYTTLYHLYKHIENDIKWSALRLSSPHPMLNYNLPVDGNWVQSTFNLKPGPIVGTILQYCLTCAYINPDITVNELKIKVEEYIKNLNIKVN